MDEAGIMQTLYSLLYLIIAFIVIWSLYQVSKVFTEEKSKKYAKSLIEYMIGSAILSIAAYFILVAIFGAKVEENYSYASEELMGFFTWMARMFSFMLFFTLIGEKAKALRKKAES